MLTTPESKTIEVNAQDGFGSLQGQIPLTTKIGQLMPTLQIPSILQLIRNTSVSVAQSLKENTRYVAETKSGSEVLISKSDGEKGTFTKDPRTMTSKNLEIMVAQFTPQMRGNKYHQIEWDTNVERLKSLLAKKFANYMSTRRVIKSFEAIVQIRNATDSTQADILADDSNATTFTKGAHVEKKDIVATSTETKADIAYQLFVDATNAFMRIGTPSATSNLNQIYGHVTGINKADMLIFMSPEFQTTLLSKSGVFASEKGNKLFRDAQIKEILGFDTNMSITLPQDVHFIIVTTGMNGTYGYEDVDGGEKGNIVTDPDWSFGKRLDLKDTFTRGVVLPFQSFVATNANSTTPKDPDNTTTTSSAPPKEDKQNFDVKTFNGDVMSLTSQERTQLKTELNLPQNTSNIILQQTLTDARTE